MTLIKLRLDFLTLLAFVNILKYIWWSLHSFFYSWVWGVRGVLKLSVSKNQKSCKQNLNIKQEIFIT